MRAPASRALPALLLAAGCAAAPGVPRVAIVAPEDGATVCGDPLHVEVVVEGLVLAEPGPLEDAEPGSGHVDLTVNGQDAAMFWEDAIDVANVPPGPSELAVELSNADHTPVEPRAEDRVVVTIVGGDHPACGG